MVFVHGEPTWSFLWRKVIPPVRDAGFRCIAPDLAGLRPLGQADRHRLVHLRPPHGERRRRCSRTSTCAARRSSCTTGAARSGCASRSSSAERIERIVILDTGLFTGRQPMNDAWMAFRDFVERTEDLPVGLLVRGACKNDPGDEVIAAYDAPFPNAASKAGARAFPLILPPTPDAPGRGRRPARARRAARATPPEAVAVGGLRPGPAARDRPSASPPRSGGERPRRSPAPATSCRRTQGPQIGASDRGLAQPPG